MMTERRRELSRHWPVVLLAFAVAIAIGVTSPDRSKPHQAEGVASAAKAR
jgi:hypothetical protein